MQAIILLMIIILSFCNLEPIKDKEHKLLVRIYAERIFPSGNKQCTHAKLAILKTYRLTFPTCCQSHTYGFVPSIIELKY